jgi:hypothetical protein
VLAAREASVHSVRALLTDGQRKHLAQLASEILAQLGT